jgi:hypothetical protein
MARKDELAILVAQTVADFAENSGIDWDGIYYRFYSDDRDHSSIQFTYRKLRELNPVRSSDEYSELLRKLMFALFDEAEQEAGKRPLVAVVEVHADMNYKIEFNYDDPRALDISLPGLGTARSYFSEGDIDIPEEVREFQRNLAKKGLAEMPMLYDPSKG